MATLRIRSRLRKSEPNPQTSRLLTVSLGARRRARRSTIGLSFGRRGFSVLTGQEQCSHFHARIGSTSKLMNNIEIVEKVLPFFKRFPFQSESKTKNFKIFKQIAMIVYSGEHLTREGFTKIVDLREGLNEGKGRKRKYEKHDVVKALVRESSETIRRTLRKQR